MSNSAKNSEEKIYIKAHVVNYLKVHPPNVYIRKSGDTILDGVAKISTDREPPLELEVESFNIPDKVSYTITEMIKGREFRITFSHKLESEESYSGALILRTNYADRPRVKIFVRSRFE